MLIDNKAREFLIKKCSQRIKGRCRYQTLHSKYCFK